MKTQAKTSLVALALLGVTAGTVLYYPSLQPAQAKPPVLPTAQVPSVLPDAGQHPRIEAVFVLDTTGSMGGLIQAAKDKIWSIASTMASAQPAPEIRVGLVAYRDRGDDYVTRVVELSKDLDAVHAELMQLQAQGGGDGPESVNAALDKALNGIAWSQDPSVYRVIFLVGDAPPHMDYQDDVPYPKTLAEAKRRGIRVNAIQCGDMGETTTEWQRIAQLGAGSYFQVEQSGSAVAIATPYDAKLAALSSELDETRVYYGKADERAKKRSKLESEKAAKAAASPAAMASRAGFVTSKSGKSALLGDKELVEEVASGRVKIEDIPAAELPEPLLGLDATAQRAAIEEKSRKRQELEGQIQKLSKERSDYLNAQVEAKGGAKDSLDHKIFNAVREQAADKGLKYDKAAPVY